MYCGGVEENLGHPTAPTMKVNADEPVEYYGRSSIVLLDNKEHLTTAQRRRKAQNRAAYVSGSPGSHLVESLLY